MIEVENHSKRYGEKLAVAGLDLAVQPGVVTGFLGPNGAGKSTAMRVIPGLDAADARSVCRARSASWPMPAMARRPHSGNDPAAPGANEGGRFPLAAPVPADAEQA